MRQAHAAAKLVGGDEAFQHRCMREAARLLSEGDPEQTPPEAGEGLYKMIYRMAGDPDPFREMKQDQNRAVMDILPWLRKTIASASDPLSMAVRLSIAGNCVDPGAQASWDLEESVTRAIESEGDLTDYEKFARKLTESNHVLLIADNCGEIVFDLVLIEGIRQERPEVEVTVAVRSAPIINDVTMAEALEVGLDRVARLVESGSEMPGTVLRRATPEFQALFESADVVISKGQGNWETLEDSAREVFFMFQAKCPAVAAMNDCPEGTLLLLANRSAC